MVPTSEINFREIMMNDLRQEEEKVKLLNLLESPHNKESLFIVLTSLKPYKRMPHFRLFIQPIINLTWIQGKFQWTDIEEQNLRKAIELIQLHFNAERTFKRIMSGNPAKAA